MGTKFRSGRFVTLEGEHGDAGAVDALDLHGGAVGLDGVASLGGASEGAEDVAAYGIEVLVRQVEFEALVHVDYGDAAVDGVEGVADLLDGRLDLVEIVLDLLDALVLGYDQTLPDNGSYVEVLSVRTDGPKQVLHVDRAKDVVEVFLVDGVARIAPVDGGVDQLGQRSVARERLDIRPWDHDLAGHPVAEVEDLVQVVALLGLENARGGGGGDHDP